MSSRLKPILRALAGEVVTPPPWWLMRQAGRYLPEYRALRSRCRDFIELCLTPALAAEATLQPVRRFGMNAAIVFSDILLLPYALGQDLGYKEEGPVLSPIRDAAGVGGLRQRDAITRLAPVFETVRRCRAALSADTALIGFAGAPWTVAAYMVEGGGSRDFRCVKGWAYADPDGFGALIDVLVEGTIELLAQQIDAGADAVQLFDSWAGILPEDAFERWVIEPSRRVVAALKLRYPQCPVIGFPRGAGPLYHRYVAETGVAALGLDSVVPLAVACGLQRQRPVQGNLDPVLLVVGGQALADAVAALRRALGGGPYIFNLGHGVLPETPPEHVATLGRLLAAP